MHEHRVLGRFSIETFDMVEKELILSSVYWIDFINIFSKSVSHVFLRTALHLKPVRYKFFKTEVPRKFIHVMQLFSGCYLVQIWQSMDFMT